MKNKASSLLKQIVSVIVTMVKAKSVAVKSKTSAMKTRLLVFGLLRNKKVLMSTISQKIHALVMGQEKEQDDKIGKAIVLYNNAHDDDQQQQQEEDRDDPSCTETVLTVEEDDYPDLRHSLFNSADDDDDNDRDDGTGSAIDLVRNSKLEDGAEFSLEDEIDHVADVFIRRFHKQMKLQKLESFKRYREMMERSLV